MNRLFSELKFIVSYNRKETFVEYEHSTDDTCINIRDYLNAYTSLDPDTEYWDSRSIITTFVTDDQILLAIKSLENKQLEVDCHELRVNNGNGNITLPYFHGLINTGKVIIGCKGISAENLEMIDDDGTEFFEVTLDLFNVIINDNTLCIVG